MTDPSSSDSAFNKRFELAAAAFRKARAELPNGTVAEVMKRTGELIAKARREAIARRKAA